MSWMPTKNMTDKNRSIYAKTSSSQLSIIMLCNFLNHIYNYRLLYVQLQLLDNLLRQKSTRDNQPRLKVVQPCRN